MRLDDAGWQAVASALPSLIRTRARNNVRTRLFLEAVIWIAVTGQRWNRLPPAWGAWHSNYVRFTRWAQDGVWDPVIASLHGHPDIAAPLGRLVASYLRACHPPREHEATLADSRLRH